MPFVVIGFVVLVAAELWVIVQVAEAVSIPLTLLLLVATSVVGVALVRREGLRTLRRARTAMTQQRGAGVPAADGLMIVIGAALLLVPGFITDALGLLLVLPGTRTPFRLALTRWLRRRSARWGGNRSRGPDGPRHPDRTPPEVIEGEVLGEARDESAHRPPPD